jgi:hypothetical protein
MTQAHLARILDDWPQAIKADDSDLRVLHDLANAGAQKWGESLFWPDYLWVGLDRPAPAPDKSAVETFAVRVPAPNALGPDANVGTVNRVTVRSTGSGRHTLSSRIDCILELKAITVDHVPKLRNFKPAIPWPVYLDQKLSHVFWKHLEHGDKQIRDFRRILGFPSARGVTIIVNEGSPSLSPEIVHACLPRMVQQLPNTDAVVYLSDTPTRPHMATFSKKPQDETSARFDDEFVMMLRMVDWSTGVPCVRGGPYPQLAIRIEIDEQSRSMYRNWCTGWRVVDDPTPVPTPKPELQIVRRGEYRSGLT